MKTDIKNQEKVLKLTTLGFTLIELLATIVVISVITLIATPMILNAIETSKKGAFEQSLNGVLKGAQLYQMETSIKNDLSNCRYFSFGNDVNDVTVRGDKTYYPLENLKLKGELPTEGELQICSDVITLEASNGKYSGSYNGDNITINKGDLASNDFKTPIIDVFNLTSKTNKIIVSAHAYSPSAGGIIVNYYYKIDNGEYIKTSDTSHIFEDLNPNTEYTIGIKVENKSGVIKEESKTVRTKAFGEITIGVENSDVWKSSKKVTITGTTSEFPLEYKIEYYNSETSSYKSTEFTTYTEPFDLDKMSTAEYPTAIIVRYKDDEVYSNLKTYNVSKIDTTAPILRLEAITQTTKTITIPFTAIDTESDIDNTTCVYGETEEYGETGTISDGKCIISGLKAGTTYYYKVITTNNSGLTKEEKGDTASGSTEISYSATQNPSGTTYAQSKNITVTYTINNVTNAVRYVKTSVATTSSIDGYACGTGTAPETCDSTVTKNFTANTWYKVASNPIVTFTANGTLYARINDGKTYSAASSFNVEKIDTTAPTLELMTANATDTTITIPISIFTDNNLIGSISSCKYSSKNGSYTIDGTINGTRSCTLNGLTTGITYYYQVCGKDNAGNETCKIGSRATIVYKETILNGTDPVLKDKLIPVTISDTGVVTYADTTKEWYKYANKQWANAVILADSPSKTYSVGDTILENDIESYFVWIPKYSYKLWDLGNYSSQTGRTTKNQTINIKFGTTNTSDANSGECTTPLTSGNPGNCAVGDYMTHPAFITLNKTGIWVGKFETGYKGATSKSEAQINSSDATKIIVKPNVFSWRSNKVSNMYNASLAYNTNLESHMMKNTEWGAASYLSNTIYGKNAQITINNCSNYVTGIGADSVSASSSSTTCTTDTNKWTGATGKLASTTGNITGVYDMSGGAYEYMAAYISGKVGASGFSTLPNNKYVDIYTNSGTYSDYSGRILGDATGEMGPFAISSYSIGSWYADGAAFVENSYPFIRRGGSYNDTSYSGPFYFHYNNGAAYSEYGFRLVLSP